MSTPSYAFTSRLDRQSTVTPTYDLLFFRNPFILRTIFNCSLRCWCTGWKSDPLLDECIVHCKQKQYAHLQMYRIVTFFVSFSFCALMVCINKLILQHLAVWHWWLQKATLAIASTLGTRSSQIDFYLLYTPSFWDYWRFIDGNNGGFAVSHVLLLHFNDPHIICINRITNTSLEDRSASAVICFNDCAQEVFRPHFRI